MKGEEPEGWKSGRENTAAGWRGSAEGEPVRPERVREAPQWDQEECRGVGERLEERRAKDGEARKKFRLHTPPLSTSPPQPLTCGVAKHPGARALLLGHP